ncbi:unnamed protein product [Prunus armeniaca]|uniref:Uncharacterized protein n=1 Tax=Prunus armeniaca TaxID=36596 RepID=A0A6J5V9Y6_PRUAR|nr:unnamed protein product [Prunus armeniaca]
MASQTSTSVNISQSPGYFFSGPNSNCDLTRKRRAFFYPVPLYSGTGRVPASKAFPVRPLLLPPPPPSSSSFDLIAGDGFTSHSQISKLTFTP